MRAAFAVIAGLTLLAGITLHRVAPRRLAVPHNSLRTLLDVLSAPRLVVALGFTALFQAGTSAPFTYVTPLLEQRYGFAAPGIAFALVLFGIGAVIGKATGGFLTDRMGPVRTLALLSVGEIVVMPALTWVTWSNAVLCLLIFVWSLLGWSFLVPQQTRLSLLDPGRLPVLLALNSAGIYIGSSLGAVAGGQALRVAGFQVLGPLGAGCIGLALFSLPVVSWLSSRQGPPA